MFCEPTGQVFVTMWRGKAVKLSLFRYGNDVIPDGYLDHDCEIVRRWMDFLLSSELRQRGIPIVTASLLVAGTVLQDSRSCNQK